jgi:glycosyltransferase involved in cell wall biosynthesis
MGGLQDFMKKIAIVITRMDLGGAQEVALETAKRLDPALHDVVLISGEGGLLDAAAEAALGPRFIRLKSLKHPISPWDDFRALCALAAHFYRQRIDLVHTHSSKAGLLGRLAAWAAGVPAIVHTVHGWSFHDFMRQPQRWIFINLERLLAGVTDALAVVALSCRDKGLLWGIGDPQHYFLLRAGVDLKSWGALQSGRAARSTLGAALKAKGAELQDSDVLVGCIANCKPQKSALDFVRTAALALKSAPQARFVYVGDGPQRQAAEGLASELGIAGRVHFLGWAEEPQPLACGFDLFLLTSLWEGLPCVFPQVLAAGIPVVATNVDGAPEIISEGKNGYLCQPGDVEALAERVAALVLKPELRQRLSAAAKAGLSPEFGFEDMAQRTGLLYQSLLKA